MTPIRLVAGLVLLALTAVGRADPPAHDSEHGAAADERRDLPMLPRMAEHQKQNMRGHLEAVAAVVAALQQDDFAAIGRAASRMGYSDEMAQMCEMFGAAAPAFTEQALAFHRTADRIGDAARARDRPRILVELGATLQACTACHASWKQKVVDPETWHQLLHGHAPAG